MRRAPGAAYYDGRVIDATALAAIDTTVGAEMERTRQPGVAIGVTDRDGTLAVRTYGFAEVASRRPVEPDTLFETGSIGKSFTAIALLQLVDEGRFDLDEPVARYLPWLEIGQREGDPPITARHLLTHTAGIVTGIDATPEAAFQAWSLRDLSTHSGPGERFHYSNVGYKVLGLVLEAVTGTPYREIVEQRLLIPLGMRATVPAVTHEVRARLAVGYAYLHDDRIGYPGAAVAPAPWLQTETADGSIASSASDMCAFVRMLLREGEGPDGHLLSPEAFAQMTTAHVRDTAGTQYGYGLAIQEIAGRRLVGHRGGMVGYLAAMETDPAAGLGAIVLQNGVGTDPLTLARAALRAVGDGTEVVVPASDGGSVLTDGTLPAGLYQPDSPGIDPVEVLVGEHAQLRVRGRDLPLVPLDEHDVFLAPDPGFDRYPFRIHRPATGSPELWHGATRYVRDGAPARPLSEPPRALTEIVGHYRSHNPWTSNFRVVLRGDQPWLVFPSPPHGFRTEQPLVPDRDGSFRIGEDPATPERISFDSVAGDRALRAWLSGWPYYRVE